MIKEVLQRDSIAETEKILGKHWSEFTEEENMFMLGKAMLDNEVKRELLKSSRDTYHSISFDDFVDIAEDYGFTLSFSYTFPYEKTTEKLAIYCHEELGLVLKLTSFFGGKSINDAELYGMLSYLKWEDVCRAAMGSNGPLKNTENGREFCIDVREGLIYKIKTLCVFAKLYPVWPERNSWLNLLDFAQSRKLGYEKYSEVKNKDVYEKVKAGDKILKKIVDFKE